MSTSSKGRKAEKIARDFLTSKGYQIIAENFRTRFGEIDLIALDGNCLVFIEVKSTSSKKFGLPEEKINQEKLRRIIKASSYFRVKHPQMPNLQRIDVVAIDFSPIGVVGEIRLFKNITG